MSDAVNAEDKRIERGRRSAVRLFAEDRELLTTVPEQLREQISREFLAEVLIADSGLWHPPIDSSEEIVGLLVLRGLLSKEVAIAGERNAELLGPGDILTRVDDYGRTIERGSALEVIVPAELAVLDQRFLRLTSRAPGLVPVLLARVGQRAHCLATHLAISRARPLSVRLHLMLWEFADRWGTRRGDSVVIPVALTHELLARVCVTGRPAVTRAIADLREQGLVSRGDDRSWVLHSAPPGHEMSELVSATNPIADL